MPYLTALIDTFNHERFIEDALQSVVEQDFPPSDLEIIVVDDGSTDRTPEIVRKFFPRVRLLRKTNGGQASAFNAGIPECRGDVVAFLDGDDWWLKNKLMRVVSVLSKDPEVVMVGHGTIKMLPNGQEFTEVLKEGFRFSVRSPEGADTFRRRKSFLGTRATVRTSILKKVLPVPATIRIEADEFVFTMAAALGEVEILPEALFCYRLHAGNFYSQHGFNPENVRRKQQSIAQLSASLALRLPELGIMKEAVDLVVEAVRLEADQLRLSVDGGKPWETARTELAMYQVFYRDAPWTHRIFKHATLLPSLVLPPRIYYGARRRLAGSDWYRKFRSLFFRPPTPGHLHHSYSSRP